MPPLPKPASTRRGHRNHTPRRVLEAVKNPKVPNLPDYCDWHPAVADFWRSAWMSPMPQEWDEPDRHNVLLAARALQTVWEDDTRPTARSAAMAEARLLLRELGLTPMAKRTLQIEIARAEDASERRAGARRKPAKADDPRRGMRAV